MLYSFNVTNVDDNRHNFRVSENARPACRVYTHLISFLYTCVKIHKYFHAFDCQPLVGRPL